METLDPASQPNPRSGNASVAALHSIVSPRDKTHLVVRVVCVGLLAISGMALAAWLETRPLGAPNPRDWFNVFYVLFARNEQAGLGLVAAFTAGIVFWLRRNSPSFRWRPRLNPRLAVPFVAVAVFAIAAIGTWLVFHQYALTADENMADFQARIFLGGEIRHKVPEFWQPMVRLIIPTHAVYDPTAHAWMSGYLPVYAAIRALFMGVDLEWLTNPILAAISVVAIGAIAGKIWPGDRWKPFLAATLLAVSPQFIVMAMTSYAMPAHLALNLVWLWLYSDPTKRRFWLAPFVGVAALGLHQPFFHALFATPFLVRLLLERRWKASAWFGAIYLVGIVSWYAWWKHFVPAFSGGSQSAFGLHGRTLLVQVMYLSLLMGWVAFPIPVLALLGFSRLRQQSVILRDIAASCVVTFGFYIFVRLDQAHGWGDRYFHGALGCLILLAVAGWERLALHVGRPAAVTFAAVGIGAAFMLQLPLRCWQAEAFTRPFARAAAAFHHYKSDVVAFEPRMAWYSADLRRNDPALMQHPIIVSFLGMREDEALLLQRTFPHARLITQADLAKLGLETSLPEPERSR